MKKLSIVLLLTIISAIIIGCIAQEPATNTNVPSTPTNPSVIDVSDDTDLLNITEGIWQFDGSEDAAYIEMDGLGSFTAYYADDSIEAEGYITCFDEYDGGKTTYNMYFNDGTPFASFVFDNDNQIHFGNDDGSIYIRYVNAGPEINIDYPVDNYVGIWEYSGEYLWLVVERNGTYSLVNSAEDVISSGTCSDVIHGLALVDEDTGERVVLTLTVNNTLEDADGYELIKVDSIGGEYVTTDISEFVGIWDYPAIGANFAIYGDYTGIIEYYDGTTYSISTIFPYNGYIEVYSDDLTDGSCYTFYKAEHGVLYDFEGNKIDFVAAIDPERESINAYVKGIWVHSDDNSMLTFNGEDFFEWIIDDMIIEGYYEYDGEMITFYSDAERYGEGRLDIDEQRIYITGDAGSYYYRA